MVRRDDWHDEPTRRERPGRDSGTSPVGQRPVRPRVVVAWTPDGEPVKVDRREPRERLCRCPGCREALYEWRLRVRLMTVAQRLAARSARPGVVAVRRLPDGPDERPRCA